MAKNGLDYTICLSDTFMHHSTNCFENFNHYNIEGHLNYPECSVPYARQLAQGRTKVIYDGLPEGKYQKHVIEGFYQFLDTVLSAGENNNL